MCLGHDGKHHPPAVTLEDLVMENQMLEPAEGVQVKLDFEAEADVAVVFVAAAGITAASVEALVSAK